MPLPFADSCPRPRVSDTLPPAGAAGLSPRAEQFYYPGHFNWRFLSGYPEAARLFNAFDYGHATLYENLLTTPPARLSQALDRQYRYLTTDLLRRPPRFGVAEVAIEPEYARIAWQAKLMFDWAHVLHRQVYDVYADPSLGAGGEGLIDRDPDRLLSEPPRLCLHGGAEVDGTDGWTVVQPGLPPAGAAVQWPDLGVSLAAGRALRAVHRRRDVPAEQKAGVAATVARFWAMLQEGKGQTPRVMPMTAAVAPNFSRRHPRAAVIFDNLHMMHDIISDILIADSVSRAGEGPDDR